MVLSQINHDLEKGQVLDIQSELDETEKSLREITLMIEQSQSEVGKLTQRNAAITSHLQKIQSDSSSTSVEEIHMAYDSALDVQQRLLMMRGQLDKLQNDEMHLERYKKLLNQASGSESQELFQAADGKRSELTNIEMIVNAQESERQRLSRQMHDGPAQALSNFILQVEIATRLLSIDVEQTRDELNSLKVSAMRTFQKVRNYIFELRPMMLDDLGLIPTIRRYAETFREQSGMEMNLLVSGTERRLESYLEVMVFRALQELLGNISRHSHATVVKIHVDVGDHLIKVTVDDNGKGFDVDLVNEGGSLGLKLIRDRVEMLGGSFEIDSSAGKGTRIVFSVPDEN